MSKDSPMDWLADAADHVRLIVIAGTTEGRLPPTRLVRREWVEAQRWAYRGQGAEVAFHELTTDEVSALADQNRAEHERWRSHVLAHRVAQAKVAEP